MKNYNRHWRSSPRMNGSFWTDIVPSFGSSRLVGTRVSFSDRLKAFKRRK